jgi:hypothetical protein
VAFRPPTVEDQEAVGGLANESSEKGARLLVRRCVDYVWDGSEGEMAERDWPAWLVDELSNRMEALDPQAELTINAQCPICDHPFSLLFDTAAYFSRELARREERFYREVHTLAFHYHWSEEEIMRLTLRERNRYIELINETVSGGRQR